MSASLYSLLEKGDDPSIVAQLLIEAELVVFYSNIILDSAVKPLEIAASSDAHSYAKKVLITNKVTTNFFTTPITPLATTLSASSTAESRIIEV